MSQELISYRDRFVITDASRVYLNGNSLGRLPKRTIEVLRECIEHQWGHELIGGWNAHWLRMAQRIGDKIGQVIGAPAGTTIVCDSTSINLYKLASALLRMSDGRRKIVTDRANFPSDLYILQGLAARATPPLEIEMVDFGAYAELEVEQRLSTAIDHRTALVCLSHVDYRSGYAFDMTRITHMAHRHGARMLWDVSHSVGAMPIALAASGADGAVGCTYKYFNGGPGAPAFLSVRHELLSALENPIQGWFGAARPFEFSPTYAPAQGIDKFVVGTPPILAMAAVEPGVDLVLEASMEWIRERSLNLTDRFIQRFEQRLRDLGYSLITPRSPEHRGSHVSLCHRHAWQIAQSLVDHYRVVPDFREPDILRFGITPLYTTPQEIDVAVEALVSAVLEKRYENYSQERIGVT